MQYYQSKDEIAFKTSQLHQHFQFFFSRCKIKNILEKPQKSKIIETKKKKKTKAFSFLI